MCQEIFLKLLSGEYTFDSPAHEKSWIIRTTINACKDHLRTAFWKRSQTVDAILEIPAPNASESELLDLVMSLPRNYRVSIYLYYYEGYQVKEIAAMYGKTENAISTYLRRGRQKLRQMLGK